MLDKPDDDTIYKKIYFLQMSVEERSFQQIFELFMRDCNEKVFIDILKLVLLLG